VTIRVHSTRLLDKNIGSLAFRDDASSIAPVVLARCSRPRPLSPRARSIHWSPYDPFRVVNSDP
jgi:hypothetical protein